MTALETQSASIALYRYLCRTIVGTEEHVKTIRMMISARDYLSSSKCLPLITSGSFGEGLEIQGSDLDIVHVMKEFEVCEVLNTTINPDTSYFTMITNGTQPGYAQLRLVSSCDLYTKGLCKKIKGSFYFSNALFKQQFLGNQLTTIHGPCVSDTSGDHDFAFCLHSKSWVTPAKQWLTRSSNLWPGLDLKQNIITHGVLFVPIGVKGSTKEDIEWRISFSVGEKFLIYTFSHTQLLCYALLKILLKDVIAIDLECKDLLCSYFIKTIIFWLSEEFPVSIWKPENLISCFMRCFRRLIYCVEYSNCPHYFIPANNLFENKIKGDARKKLLSNLYMLNRSGWKCIGYSNRIVNFAKWTYSDLQEPAYVNVISLKKLLFSRILYCTIITNLSSKVLEKGIPFAVFCKSSTIKQLYVYYVSKTLTLGSNTLQWTEKFGNKYSYKEYTTGVRTLLMKIHHDVVSGWLMLASFSYKAKRYNKALDIIHYALLKCTPDKLYTRINMLQIHHELLNNNTFRKMNCFQLCKLMLVDYLSFEEMSILIPDELQMESMLIVFRLPSVAYGHFLKYLCYYHLKDTKNCQDCLLDLKVTIDEKYLISDKFLQASAYNILGITFQLSGDIESARQAYMQSTSIIKESECNSSHQRLSLLDHI